MKHFIRYVFVFCMTAALLISLFLAVAAIPRHAIQENVRTSAEYLSKQKGAFPSIFLGLSSSSMDYYADAVLMDIAWYLDPAHPVESISWAKYYAEDKFNYNGFVKRDFLNSVTKEISPNQQYLRYWHGSIVLVKPMLILWDIRGIYVVHGLAILLLMIWLIRLLYQQNCRSEAIAFLISMVAVSIWFVPICMEYVWMFLCMLITSIMTVKLMRARREQWLPVLFLVTGMVAVFLDFFTTETMTLAIPLLFMIRIRKREGLQEGTWRAVFTNTILWGIGYIGMWILKWGFAAFCLHQNVLPFIRESVWEHLRSESNMTFLEMKRQTVSRNIHNLFPLEYGIIGQVFIIIMIILVVVLPVLRDRIRLKPVFNWYWIALYTFAGLIPIARYLVISNHSYVHAFFVYRALASTVMASCLIITEFVKRNPSKRSETKVVPK